MTSASTRMWTFAAIIAIVAIVALGWFLGISPKIAEISRFDSERQVVSAQNEANRATLQVLQNDVENLQSFRQQLDEVAAEFPALPDYPTLIETLFTDLLAQSLTLESVALSEPVPASIDTPLNEFGQVSPATLLRLDGVVTVKGEVNQALALVEALQQDARFIAISNVVYSEGRDPESRSTTINFAVFMLAGEAADGAIQVSATPDGPQEQARDDEASNE